MLHGIIMAGGSGTRFWPASRTVRPKQLLSLGEGDKSMIQATVDRLGEAIPPARVLVVTNERLVDPIRSQLPSLPKDSVLGEPCKRDTAPCIGVAAAWVQKHDPDATMVVMPSDHIIGPDEVFQDAIRYAEKLVSENPQRIVTFGIKPTYPAESFGYVQRGSALSGDSIPAFQVEQFKEKPSLEVAQSYLEAGTFYWNSGIFVWKASKILDELAKREPDMYSHIQKIGAAIGTGQFQDVFQKEFAAIVGKSIDYAVMEHAKEVVVIEAPFQWDDVGSWRSLARLHGTGDDGNTVIGRHLGIETEGSIVRSEGDHLIVTIGMKDCIVVHTEDATLVADKAREESVREVVKKLDSLGWKEYL